MVPDDLDLALSRRLPLSISVGEVMTTTGSGDLDLGITQAWSYLGAHGSDVSRLGTCGFSQSSFLLFTLLVLKWQTRGMDDGVTSCYLGKGGEEFLLEPVLWRAGVTPEI